MWRCRFVRFMIIMALGLPPLAQASALYFESNLGQTERRVKFLSYQEDAALLLTPHEMILARYQSVRPTTLVMSFVGAHSNSEMMGEAPLAAMSHYIAGNDPQKWLTDIPRYARVRYRDIYPGIDLVVYGNHEYLQYELIVASGANVNAIRLAFEGVETLALDIQGNLILHMGDGRIMRQPRPAIYQEIDGAKHTLAGKYVLYGKRQVGLQVVGDVATKPFVAGADTISLAADGARKVSVTGATKSKQVRATPEAF